eukprot:9489622-Pyramimonas_sp.AAC.2
MSTLSANKTATEYLRCADLWTMMLRRPYQTWASHRKAHRKGTGDNAGIVAEKKPADTGYCTEHYRRYAELASPFTTDLFTCSALRET